MDAILNKLHANILLDRMNTDTCSKNGGMDLKSSERSLKMHQQMDKVTSLLSFFSETTTGNSNDGTEVENKNGNDSAEVSLSELTDIFGLKGNVNTTTPRKRSNTDVIGTNAKRNRLSSPFSEAEKKNNTELINGTTSGLVKSTVINTSASESKVCEMLNNCQPKNVVVTPQKPTSDEEVALVASTPAPPLTPHGISNQSDISHNNASSEVSADYCSAKEDPSEFTEMPTLKEVSPLLQKETFTVHDSRHQNRRKCEFRTCGFYYKSNEEYRFHYKGHVTTSAFKCSKCDLYFAGLTYLSHHEKFWCAIKNTIERDLPKPLATSTPTISHVRKEVVSMPQPQRVNFPPNINENPIKLTPPPSYDNLNKKSNSTSQNKEIPVQNFNPSFIKQPGRDSFRGSQSNNNFNLPEPIPKQNVFELPKPGCVVLQNSQIPEPRTTQTQKLSMPVPIISNINIADMRPKRIYCKVESCGFSTEIETLYRDHYCEFHNGESSEICEYCSSGFSSKRILSQHRTKYCKIAASCIKKLHSDPRVDPNFLKKSMERPMFVDSDKRESCPYQCEFKGTSELDMINHISNFHQAEGRFPCSGCELKFSSNDLLAVHEELYCSKLSDRSFSRIKGTTNDFKCPHVTCSFRTLSIKIFKHHLNGHCDNFTTRHSCNNCKQYFSSEVVLEQHSRFPCCYKKTKRDLNIVNTLMDVAYENC